MSDKDNKYKIDIGQDNVETPIIRLFKQYGIEYWWLVALGLVCSVLWPAFSLLPLYFVETAIDSIIMDQTEFSFLFFTESLLPESLAGQIAAIFVFLSLIWVVAVFSLWGSKYCWGKFSEKVRHDVRVDTYEQAQELPISFFDNEQTGQLLSILNNDVQKLSSVLGDIIPAITNSFLRVFFVIFFLVFLHWELAIITILIVPIVAVVAFSYAKKIKPIHRTLRQRIGMLNSKLENNIQGMEVIKNFSEKDTEYRNVVNYSEKVYESGLELVAIRSKVNPIVHSINFTAFILTLLLGIYWLSDGPPLFFSNELQVGTLTAVLLFSFQVGDPLLTLIQQVNSYLKSRASIERIFAIQETELMFDSNSDGEIELDRISSITFDSIGFSYDDEEKVLNNINFSVEQGEGVGVVGPTGSGKTTLMKLILRMHKIDQGEIRINGEPIHRYSIDDIRDAIGMVRQEPFMFTGTIKENMTYGSSDVNDDEMIDAAKKANIHSFITQLADGYQTDIGEKGVKLSGGQKQRIALARVIIKDPEIIILDEATSHVDNRTEVLIQNAIREFTEGKTTFAVAHRLSTVKDLDTIVVFDDGEQVEQGSHNELIQKEGLYANLWKVQIGEVEQVSRDFFEEKITGDDMSATHD